MVSQETENGTWTVTADCYFTNEAAGGAVRDSGAGAVVTDGQEILFMDSGPDIAGTFTAKRLNAHP